MNRVLIVEDEPGIRESLEDFFTGRGFLVSTAATAQGTLEALEKETLSLILLDLRLPDGDGLDLLRALRRRGDRTPVIIVTARGEEAQRVRGLKYGADDYVVKPFSAVELLARVEAVLRRTGSVPSTLRIGDAEVDLAGHEIRREGECHRLLQKEAELLAFLVRHPGQTFRREDLLREVWGYDEFPTTRTVDTHVFNLRRKLEARPEAPRHLLTVHGVGYKLQGILPATIVS